jgi:hypothetical protein
MTDRESFEANPHFRAFKMAGQRIGLFEPMMGGNVKFELDLISCCHLIGSGGDRVREAAELITKLVEGTDRL